MIPPAPHIPGPFVLLLGFAGTLLPILVGIISAPSRIFAAALWVIFLAAMVRRVIR